MLKRTAALLSLGVLCAGCLFGCSSNTMEQLERDMAGDPRQDSAYYAAPDGKVNGNSYQDPLEKLGDKLEDAVDRGADALKDTPDATG